VELTTVTEHSAALHDGTVVRRYEGLAPGTLHDLDGVAVRTLPRPDGELLARFGTVNDVHFGEVEAGVVDGLDLGPTFSSPPGAEPYPELMNRAAVAELVAADLDAVVVKGDLTSRGSLEEYERFLEVYEGALGDRLHHFRGNHESYHHLEVGRPTPYSVTLPGVVLAMVDTSIDGRPNGGLDDDTLTWLGDLAAGSDHPVLVFGHHHCWDPGSRQRPDDYFGISPADSERLVAAMAAQPALRGYFAGHTHRNRVRRFSATGDRPFVEVASVKEFPGVWAEYRVYETGVVQAVHRISDPEALRWTDRTRVMYGGTFEAYAMGSMADRCFVIPTT
jgi:3',5'-cyclic AMP phosphodiesterase CpdA